MLSKDGLEIDATVTVDAAHLSIRYRVKNTSSNKAFLQNRVDMPDRSGVPRMHKDYAFVYVAKDGVVVEKDIPRVPEGLHPNELVIPHMTLLPPGGEFQETVELPLPLRDSRPYGSSPPSDRQVSVSEVRFVLGYSVTPPETRDFTIPVGADSAAQFELPPGGRETADRFSILAPVVFADTGKPASVPALLPSR